MDERLINLSELDPAWRWIEAGLASRFPAQRHASTLDGVGGRWRRRLRALRRVRGWLSESPGPHVLVTHGPRPSALWGLLGTRRRVRRWLAMSFNFTDEPRGAGLWIYRWALRRVDAFIVASTAEADRYADLFRLPRERFHVQTWCIRPPRPPEDPPPATPYLIGMGGQGRDYGTLLEALRPEWRLLLVAPDEAVPADAAQRPNVQVVNGIPRAEALRLLAGARLLVLPLRDAQVPCGHVTVVQAQHLGVPVIASEGRGLADYLADGQTGWLVPPGDARALSAAIARALAEPHERQRRADAARDWAALHCTEDVLRDRVLALLDAECAA